MKEKTGPSGPATSPTERATETTAEMGRAPHFRIHDGTADLVISLDLPS